MVDPRSPQPDAIRQAVETLRRGGLVAFPTDTLYALGADALAEEAVERVLTVKGRSRGKPLSVLVPSVDAIGAVDVSLTAELRDLLRTFWPGPLTVVVKASPRFPAALTGATGTVGLRIPAGAVARALLKEFGGAVVGTSANKAGGPDPGDAKAVQRAIGGQIDLILDGGRVALGVPSTVLDCTTTPVRILREGAIPRVLIGVGAMVFLSFDSEPSKAPTVKKNATTRIFEVVRRINTSTIETVDKSGSIQEWTRSK